MKKIIFIISLIIAAISTTTTQNNIFAFTINDPEFTHLPGHLPYTEMITNGCLTSIPNLQDTDLNNDEIIIDSKALNDLGLPPLLLTQSADMCLEVAQGMMSNGWIMTKYIVNPNDPNDIVINLQSVGNN